jgi:hypothetical protein
MKRIFVILLFLVSTCLAQTFVSSAGYEDVSGAAYGTANVVFSSGVAAGNTVACYINHGTSGNAGLTLTVTGTGGEPFAQAGTNAEVNANSWSGLYIRSNSGGGTPYTAKFTFSPAGYANYVAVVCAQYSSASGTLILDQAAQGVNNASTGTYPYNSCTTSSFTTTSPNELIILAGTGGPPYAATGFTLRGTSGNSSAVGLLEKAVTTIQNATTATVTGSSYNNWNCNLATLVKGTSPAPSVSAVRSRSTSY